MVDILSPDAEQSPSPGWVEGNVVRLAIVALVTGVAVACAPTPTAGTTTPHAEPTPARIPPAPSSARTPASEDAGPLSPPEQGDAAGSQSAAAAAELFEAVGAGDETRVKSLLDAGVSADVADPADPSGKIRPIHRALYDGHLAIANLLLDRGADITASDEITGTPLGIAIFQLSTNDKEEYEPVAARLIRAGSSISGGDKDGGTILMAVVQAGSLKLTELLLERGAAVNQTDGSGRTALDLAIESNDQPLVILLKEHGAKRGSYRAPRK